MLITPSPLGVSGRAVVSIVAALMASQAIMMVNPSSTPRATARHQHFDPTVVSEELPACLVVDMPQRGTGRRQPPSLPRWYEQMCESPNIWAPVSVGAIKRGGFRVVQEDTRPIGRTEGVGDTQLAKVLLLKRWERRLGPLTSRCRRQDAL